MASTPKRIRVDRKLVPRCPKCLKNGCTTFADTCDDCERDGRTYADVEFSTEEWKQIEEYAEVLKINAPQFTLTGYQTPTDLGRCEHRRECRTIAAWTGEIGNAPFNDDRFRGGMNGTGPGIVIQISRRIAARRKAFELASVSIFEWPTEEERTAWDDSLFIKKLEKRSMSTWTEQETRRYNDLTGQVHVCDNNECETFTN
jgi:hypothetical protein